MSQAIPMVRSGTIPLLAKIAEFGERRQEVLAGNIANIDTPDYKTRDLPVAKFQEALKTAVSSRRQPQSLSLSTQQPPTTSELFSPELFRAGEAAANNITFQDGGNRSIEHEVMQMSQNAMLQNLAVELMVAQFNMLQTVISERP
jgi:flagellar basal-body rod protein FlgB